MFLTVPCPLGSGFIAKLNGYNFSWCFRMHWQAHRFLLQSIGCHWQLPIDYMLKRNGKAQCQVQAVLIVHLTVKSPCLKSLRWHWQSHTIPRHGSRMKWNLVLTSLLFKSPQRQTPTSGTPMYPFKLNAHPLCAHPMQLQVQRQCHPQSSSCLKANPTLQLSQVWTQCAVDPLRG